MKINPFRLQFLFIVLLGLYPLLKFNFSSIIFILFVLTSIFIGFKYKTFVFNAKSLKSFLLYSLYFFLILISVFYSSNQQESINRIIQLSPLLFLPFILSFIRLQLTNHLKYLVLNIFVITNIIFSFVIIGILLYNFNKTSFHLAYFLFDYDKFQFTINENIGNDALFVHKAYFSMGFVICAIFCLKQAIYYVSKNKFYFSLCSIGFIYFFLWIFYAFSFPNVIALVLSVIILLYYKLNTKIFFSGLILLGILTSGLIVIKINDIDFKRGFNFIKSITNEDKFEVNDTRKEIYNSHKNILKTSNTSQLLFGLGIGDVQDQLNKAYKQSLSDRKITNLVLFNEEFNELFWHKNNINVKPNVTKSFDGNLNADYIYDSFDNKETSHNISTKIKIDEKAIYTFSVFAKQKEKTELILRFGDVNQLAIFDLEKGEELKILNVIKSSISPLDNNWYRCSISVSLSKESLAIIGLSNENSEYLYVAEGGGLYIWGAQIEKGELTKYNKNTSNLILSAINDELNSHNNYLFFIMATGIFGLIAFLIPIIFLYIKSIKERDPLKISFCLIFSFNCLTENILLRHWGLMFLAFMFLVLFLNQKEKIQD